MPNRLAAETSPYLLQHAHNPVDWFPWGDDAFARAQELDRPILLSIGYSACHWCHVMERESFEDPETAALMNELFVNVKVDREERPDVDQIYMRAVQSMTGRGGWPLTAVLTPDGRPFFGGTYFPPVPRHRMPSFEDVLRATARAYRDKRAEVESTAAQLTEMLERSSALGAAEPELDPDLLEDASERIRAEFDATHGGFGSAPKFPQPVVLDFLLSRYARSRDPDTLHAVEHTLTRMAQGGLQDQLAGGFHRYSVDVRWLVPHFEKMLYDNALLARCYVDAWRHTGQSRYGRVAVRTLDWMIRDLQAADGTFHSAYDADSEGEEGRYYVWSLEEVREFLGDEAEVFARTYDVSAQGNFEGHSILHLPHAPEAVARALEMDPDGLEAILARGRERLLAARAQRVPPARDTKALAGWNGMAIRALAEAGGAFGERRFVEAASACVRHWLDHMREGGVLHRVWDGERAHVPAFLEDHGALGMGLLALHAVTLDPALLDDVAWIAEEITTRFRDPDSGRLYDAPRDGEGLIVRPREVQDSATPSGNALAMELLVQAGRLFDRPDWIAAAEGALAALLPVAVRYPLGFGRLLAVADLTLHPALEVTVVGPAGAERDVLVATTLARPLPGRLVAGAEEAVETVPLLRDRPVQDGSPTAYVCVAGTCSLPVRDASALGALLDRARLD